MGLLRLRTGLMAAQVGPAYEVLLSGLKNGILTAVNRNGM